jgi:shikimate kinase
MRTNRNIIFIGMPGAGKSTVGVLLAKHLGYAFVDTDIEIQTGEGRSLADLIAAHGRQGFRQIEERYILSLDCHAYVIAPGGSVIYSPMAMQHLAARGTIVFLHLDPAGLRRRLGSLTARGVLRAPGQSLEDLFHERDPLYRRYADLVVECGQLTAQEVMDQIAARLP